MAGGTSPTVSAANRRRLEALDRSMQASRGQRGTATPSSSTAPPRRPRPAPRPAPPPAPDATAGDTMYAPLPRRALERGPVATMLKGRPPPTHAGGASTALQLTLEELASTWSAIKRKPKKGEDAPSSAPAPTSSLRLPDKPLLLDNPTALLPRSTPPARLRRLPPRPSRAARAAAAAAHGGLKRVPPAALTALTQSWQRIVADVIARDGATPATLAPLTTAGAPLTVETARDGRAARVSGVLVSASPTSWRVAVDGGRVVTVGRAGSVVRVEADGVAWRVVS